MFDRLMELELELKKLNDGLIEVGIKGKNYRKKDILTFWRTRET